MQKTPVWKNGKKSKDTGLPKDTCRRYLSADQFCHAHGVTSWKPLNLLYFVVIFDGLVNWQICLFYSFKDNFFLFRKLCSNYKIQIRCTKPFHKTVWTFGLSCQKITWSFNQISAKCHLVNGIHIPLSDEVRKSILVMRLSVSGVLVWSFFSIECSLFQPIFAVKSFYSAN